MKKKLLFSSNEWTTESIEKTWKIIDKIAKEDFGLDYYEPQIEIITYDQMLDAYMNHGMPTYYTHWSFGKHYFAQEHSYKKGESGLAYELVINSDPAIAYLMESNSMAMQTLVLAHACCGHVHFFKNNYLFKQYTDAGHIVPYLKYAKKFVDHCIETYGVDRVDRILDAAHALQLYGVDHYPRGNSEPKEEIFNPELKHIVDHFIDCKEELRVTPGFHAMERAVNRTNTFMDAIDFRYNYADPERYVWKRGFPEENILLFLEQMSPLLFDWERVLIRIVRNIATYFYPQYQTKLMNEAFATAMHYELLNSLYDKGYISEGCMMECLHSHTSVCCQHKHAKVNVYSLGFAIFQDLKRICLNPTDEDREWFPLIAGSKDWLSVWKDCVANYRDESFVLQFLSPKVIRDFKLFSVLTKEKSDYMEISTTHKMEDIHRIRKLLSREYTVAHHTPNIEITSVDWSTQTIHLGIKDHDEFGPDVDSDSLSKVWELMLNLWPKTGDITFL